MKKIAVVGGGISGLATAYYLRDAYDVRLFEAAPRIGGHANTVEVTRGEKTRAVDTAFLVYNDRNYPTFMRLLAELGVKGQPTTVSFAVRDDAEGVEYATHNPRLVLSQPKNLLKPEVHRLVWDALRFKRVARRWNERPAATLGDFLAAERFGRAFCEFVALPLTATVWSIDPVRAREFPFLVWWRFLENHGFDQMLSPPTWHAFEHGSRTYVDAIGRVLGDRIVRGAPIASVKRREDGGVLVTPRHGLPERFDAVVLAVHSDQALAMLDAPTAAEGEALRSIPFVKSEVALHVDSSVMPKDRGAWSAWNYLRGVDAPGPTVTYDLNILHRFMDETTYLVSLNETALLDPTRVLDRFEYEHPRYFHASIAARAKLREISGADRVFFAGAYMGMGFHEDGVKSALEVVRALGRAPA